MTIARRVLVKDGKEGIYHCWSRCVRRAFLCGNDPYSGKNYDHRKLWIRKRVEELTKIFAIDTLAYAVMDNHEHLLLRIREDILSNLDDEEVATRWLMLYPKFRKKNGIPLPPTQNHIDAITQSPALVRTYKMRLGSLSWFMKCLNEFIARAANKEDECTGSFWEGRFKCKEITDEASLLVCAAYIDLNPIRAFKATSPEQSHFTSIAERIRHYRENRREERSQPVNNLWLAPICKQTSPEGFLSLTLDEYLTIVDQTGRQLAKDNTGRIPKSLPPILERIGIIPSRWRRLLEGVPEGFSLVIGSPKHLEQKAKALNKKWLKGITLSRHCFA